METIAKAFAGHAARTQDTPALHAKASRYDNPLTDLVAIAIAEQAALKTLDELADECLAEPAVRAAYEAQEPEQTV